MICNSPCMCSYSIEYLLSTFFFDLLSVANCSSSSRELMFLLTWIRSSVKSGVNLGGKFLKIPMKADAIVPAAFLASDVRSSRDCAYS